MNKCVKCLGRWGTSTQYTAKWMNSLNLSYELCLNGHSHLQESKKTDLFVEFLQHPGPWCTLIFWLLKPALQFVHLPSCSVWIDSCFCQTRRNRIKQPPKCNYNDSNLGMNDYITSCQYVLPAVLMMRESKSAIFSISKKSNKPEWVEKINEISDLAQAYVSSHLNNSVRIWPFCWMNTKLSTFRSKIKYVGKDTKSPMSTQHSWTEVKKTMNSI